MPTEHLIKNMSVAVNGKEFGILCGQQKNVYTIMMVLEHKDPNQQFGVPQKVKYMASF